MITNSSISYSNATDRQSLLLSFDKMEELQRAARKERAAHLVSIFRGLVSRISMMRARTLANAGGDANAVPA
jgi:hypothetical protein